MQHRGLHGPRLERVLRYIDKRLSEPICLTELADVAAMSRFHFIRAFRVATGHTPKRYIRSRRIEAAAILLSSTDHAIAGIAVECGFPDQTHFTTVFRRATGMTPAVYRRQARLGLAGQDPPEDYSI